MGSLVFCESLEFPLALLRKSRIRKVGHPAHNTLVSLGAHLGRELTAEFEGVGTL